MLTRLDEGLFSAETEIPLPLGARLPLRMTVLRLGDGSLCLHSPVAIDDALATEIAAQGEVRHIVAPNLLHHLFVKAALDRYPRALLHAARGLAEKRPDLRIDHVLGDRDA